ncbi:MAG TPA: hypothetical protein VIM63_14905 [Rhodoferax sp.]
MSASLPRRHWLKAALLVPGTGAVWTPPVATAELPVPASLADELSRALTQHNPLLVAVTLRGCPFCKIATENYLMPLQREQGLPVVQIDMRSGQAIQGFSGTVQTHASLSHLWGVKVAPTVLFFGRGGVEVAERLVGGYLPDFYGSYLDERVRVARLALRG